jgi:hypothetical protein
MEEQLLKSMGVSDENKVAELNLMPKPQSGLKIREVTNDRSGRNNIQISTPPKARMDSSFS